MPLINSDGNLVVDMTNGVEEGSNPMPILSNSSMIKSGGTRKTTSKIESILARKAIVPLMSPAGRRPAG